jgi:hypothetical protein
MLIVSSYKPVKGCSIRVPESFALWLANQLRFVVQKGAGAYLRLAC